jgi:excisionase family DNA binding protein
MRVLSAVGSGRIPNFSHSKESVMPNLMTIQEVAAFYKVAPRTVRNWIDEGRLEIVRLGPKLIRIEEEALYRFMR